MTIELDLDQHRREAAHQISSRKIFSSKVIVRKDRYIHVPTALKRPLKWLVKQQYTKIFYNIKCATHAKKLSDFSLPQVPRDYIKPWYSLGSMLK